MNKPSFPIPEKYSCLIGQLLLFEGYLFDTEYVLETEFEVLDVRWSSSVITPLKGEFMTHPAIEYLLKKESHLPRWTVPIGVVEIVKEQDKWIKL